MEWNVVVSIYKDGYKRALRALGKLGRAEPSPFYNVLLMDAHDPLQSISALEQQTEENPALYDAIARVAPAMRNFEFQSTEEFHERVKPILLDWAPRLAGRSFHVRIHRRGGPADLHATAGEKSLDAMIADATAAAGEPAKVSFKEPDAVIVIDTVGTRAGVSLWTGDDFAHHRLLRPD